MLKAKVYKEREANGTKSPSVFLPHFPSMLLLPVNTISIIHKPENIASLNKPNLTYFMIEIPRNPPKTSQKALYSQLHVKLQK